MEKNLAILSAIFVTLYNMQIRPWTPLGDFQTPGATTPNENFWHCHWPQ